MQVSTAPAPSEQPVVVPPPRPRQRWRSLVATLLIVIGCILAPLAGVAVWAKNQVTDTDRYVATVAPLASDPAIQNAVADKVTAADQVRLVFSNGVCGRTGICAIKGSTRPTRSFDVGTHAGVLERSADAADDRVRVAVRPCQLGSDVGVLDVIHDHHRYRRCAAASITALLRMRQTVATASESLRADTGVGRLGQTIKAMSWSSAVLMSSTLNRSD